jgi:quercetin dioxygenase-like cupin family protein
MKRIAFDDMAWETGPSGLRFKAQKVGARQFRLLELTPELDHSYWCETGHVGYVLEGEMEVEFAEGSPVVFRAGDGVLIPAGKAERHRPRVLTDRVRLIFVEDLVEDIESR